jgi:hypothetical protein
VVILLGVLSLFCLVLISQATIYNHHVRIYINTYFMKSILSFSLLVIFSQQLLAQANCINEGSLNSNQVAMLNATAAGDTLLTSSGIGAEVSLVQPITPFFGPFNIMSYSNDSIWHTGSFELHASSNCNNHTVTFYSIYEDQLIIDGDTIFTSPVGNSFNYIGTNYTVDKDSSNYTITGDFNVISINTQTNQLANICISCDNTLSIEDDSIL